MAVNYRHVKIKNNTALRQDEWNNILVGSKIVSTEYLADQV